MIVAENYVLNNEWGPNNEVLCISSHHSVIRGIHVNASVNVRETYVIHSDTRSRAQLGKRCTWPPRVQVRLDSLPR